MQPTDKYIYENVVPSKSKIFSTNLKFKDTNDLFELEKKRDLVHHAKKINKYILKFILTSVTPCPVRALVSKNSSSWPSVS